MEKETEEDKIIAGDSDPNLGDDCRPKTTTDSGSAPESGVKIDSMGRVRAPGQERGLMQNANPLLHRERMTGNDIRARHGLRSFETTGLVRCLDSACPLVKREKCPYFVGYNNEPDKGPCPLVEAFERERIGELMGLDWIMETDLPVVRVLIKNEILVRLCEAWFFRTGLWRKRGSNPAIAIYMRALNGMLAAAKDLGLNPKARQELGIQRATAEDVLTKLANRKWDERDVLERDAQRRDGDGGAADAESAGDGGKADYGQADKVVDDQS